MEIRAFVRTFDELLIWDRERRPCFKNKAARELLLPCRLSALNRLHFSGVRIMTERSLIFQIGAGDASKLPDTGPDFTEMPETSIYFEKSKEKRG